MEIKKYQIFITPKTHVRITKKERWMFAKGVTDKYLIEYGTRVYNKKVLEGKKTTRSPKSYYNRKQIIKRYFDYKRALKAEVDRLGFVMPQEGIWLKFFIPIPVSWSKKKKREKQFELHTSKPDTDNLAKAFFDSLGIKDEGISDYRATKYWYDGVNGFIEITLGELPPTNGYTKIVHQEKIK